MKSSEKPYDNLTEITGIGPARQQWLREALGVRTYEDLAALAVEDVESRLRADGQIPSRAAIEKWLRQARELAAAAPAEANSPVGEDGWKPFASFVVEFQVRERLGQARQRRTAVHYMEEDRGASWPGIEHKRLCRWMVDQIHDEVELELEEPEAAPGEPAPGPPTERIRPRLEIRQLRIFQPPAAGTPGQVVDAGRVFAGRVRGSEPFALEVDVELTGPAAAGVARRQVKCTAAAYAYDEAGGRSIHLGNSDPRALQPEDHTYTFALPQATLPPGSYRLLVLIQPPSAAVMLPDYIEVPVFTVD